MGRILLIIAVVIGLLFVAGSLFGLLVGLLKWALILGAIALGVVGIAKLVNTGRRSRSMR